MEPDEVTDSTVAVFEEAAVARQDARAGIAAVLSMPEVRQAIYDQVRRESDEKLKAMGVTGYSLEWDR
jgi:hypothetical protein